MASKSMTKSEIAAHLAEKAGLTKKQVTIFLAAQADLAYKQAKNVFTLPGLGKLKLVDRPARKMIMRFGPDAGKESLFPRARRCASLSPRQRRTPSSAPRSKLGQRVNVQPRGSEQPRGFFVFSPGGCKDRIQHKSPGCASGASMGRIPLRRL